MQSPAGAQRCRKQDSHDHGRLPRWSGAKAFILLASEYCSLSAVFRGKADICGAAKIRSSAAVMYPRLSPARCSLCREGPILVWTSDVLGGARRKER